MQAHSKGHAGGPGGEEEEAGQAWGTGEGLPPPILPAE